MPEVLLTGATGTVGHAIARRLIAEGRSVRALVRSPDRARKILPSGVEPFAGDVTDADSVRSAVAGCRVVFHTAGLPEQWLADNAVFDRVNVGGTRNLVEASLGAGVQGFVYTSTIDVFAWKHGAEFDESVIESGERATHYERSKQAADRLVSAAIDRGLPARFLHPSGVYGPAPSVNPGVNDFLARLRRGEIPMLLPGGMPVVFSDDVAAGHLRAEKAPVGARYIVSESYQSLTDVARAVVEVTGRGKVPPVLPGWFARIVSEVGELAARFTGRPPLIPRGQLHFLRDEVHPSSRRAREELGWTPTPFTEGVRRTLEAIA